MIKLNDVHIIPTIFPDKTSQVWKLPEGLIQRRNKINWHFEYEGEFMHLAQLHQLLTGGFVKKIQKWCAKDGTEFFEEEQCREYERHCKAVKEALEPLGKIPNLPACGFQNGGGYLQHDRETFMTVRNKLLELAKKFTDHKWIQQSIDKGTKVHSSYAGRIISECTTVPLNRAWQRIECVDKECREWGQPYYAKHPNEAKQIRLN